MFAEDLLLSKSNILPDCFSHFTENDFSNSSLVKLIKDRKNLFPVFQKRALLIKQKVFGPAVFLRGLIEISNYCRNNCFYCGIRKGNSSLERYRLSDDEILSSCRKGYELGLRTFVLQGGEDSYFTKQKISLLVEQIKKEFPDCAVTLSLGQHSKSTYKAWLDSGADRFLLRHESASPSHFKKLHPVNQTLSSRKKCLSNLSSLGFQTGSGFMVGSPFQTESDLADDILYLLKLKPAMIGIGPFIPHSQTPFKNHSAGSVELTLFLISLLRILFPYSLIPATTALATLDGDSRITALLSGANVVMPNLTPDKDRKNYSLYNNKACTGSEALEGINELKISLEQNGMKIDINRGDFILKRNYILQE